MARNAILKCRVTSDEKADFEHKAAEIGANSSELARAMLFSDDKLIVLSGGSEIVSQLYRLNTQLESACKAGRLSAETLVDIKREIGKMASALCDIAQHTADLSGDEECDTE